MWRATSFIMLERWGGNSVPKMCSSRRVELDSSHDIPRQSNEHHPSIGDSFEAYAVVKFDSISRLKAAAKTQVSEQGWSWSLYTGRQWREA